MRSIFLIKIDPTMTKASTRKTSIKVGKKTGASTVNSSTKSLQLYLENEKSLFVKNLRRYVDRHKKYDEKRSRILQIFRSFFYAVDDFYENVTVHGKNGAPTEVLLRSKSISFVKMRIGGKFFVNIDFDRDELMNDPAQVWMNDHVEKDSPHIFSMEEEDFEAKVFVFFKTILDSSAMSEFSSSRRTTTIFDVAPSMKDQDHEP